MATLHDWLSFLVNVDLLSTYGGRLLSGLRITIELVLVSVPAGLLLAYPICRVRMSKHPVLSFLALAYVTIFRGTPLLCQLYLVYYGGGQLRQSLTAMGLWTFFRDPFFCAIFAFALNTAAYQSEILRGALLGVPKGQVEAALALGLSRYRIARHVIWPQAFLIALRPYGNEVIAMLKAGSLAAFVTLYDLFAQTRFVFARTFDFSVYLYAAIIYLLMTEGLRRAWAAMEQSASRHLAIVPEAAQDQRQPETLPLVARGAKADS